MKTIFRIRLLPLLFLFESCVDPLAVPAFLQENKLVVDGLITNQAGPYEIRLSYAMAFGTTLRRSQVESGARVRIVNDLNESELLTEVNPGIYRTSSSGMRGKVGRSYYVQITTSGNKEYRSLPQVMADAGSIDTLYAEYDKNVIKVNGNPADAVAIFLDAHGTHDAPGLYRWRWTSVFKGKTFPELRDSVTKSGIIPNPEPCSGYIARGGLIYKVAECTCCICWSYDYSTKALISDNRFTQELQFRKVPLLTQAITGMRFYERLDVEVEQLSISEEMYEFWKLVKAQQESSGSLFQPNAVNVKGNIISVTNPREEVLGAFSVSAITKGYISILRDEIPFEIPPLEVIPYDCRNGLLNATTDRPYF